MDQFRRGPLTFDVRDGGPPDGEPVVLLHGFPQDKDAWLSVEPLLHEAGYRTLSPDQRGYSPGARPKGRRSYTADKLVDDVLALLDAAELDSAHVVGHDWGAAVAWGVASRAPERVRSLTALSVPHTVAFTQALKGPQLAKSWYIGAFQLPFLPELLVGSSKLGPALVKMGVPKELARGYGEKMQEPGRATAAINWYRGLPFTRETVHRSSVPTTFAWGSGDTYISRKGAENCEKFVTGPYRFVEIDGDHWLPENHPEEIAALIVERAQSAAPAGETTAPPVGS